jgi:small GTP-binding protein
VKELQQIKQCNSLAQCDPDVTFEGVSSQSHCDNEFTVLFLGSSGVGKTCLLQLLNNQTYDINSSVPTVGMSVVVQSYKYNSSYVQMVLTDTAGQENHCSLPPIIFRRIDSVFLVYDVTDYDTFDMLPYWMEMLEHHAPKTCKVLLVGNKVDLRDNIESEKMVPQTAALEFANRFGFPYVETSAKDIDSIMNMMQKMVEILMSTVSVRVEDVSVILKKGKHKKGCRCSLI